jgi:hypothetical protein
VDEDAPRPHRAVDGPRAQDLREYLAATGIRDGLLFARPDGAPWRKHDYDNWRERDVYKRHAGAVALGATRTTCAAPGSR